jgi:DNA-binding NtrC family response regulator
VILNSNCPVTTVNWDLETLTTRDILKDRRILVVDDEPDIIETTKEILDMCVIDSALDFESAKKILKANTYDIAILDIAGVKGFDLLEIAVKKNIPVLMLTAHALTPENLKKSIEKGATSYIPKDELVNIADHAADVIRTRLKGKKHGAWFSNLKSLFDNKFGLNWKDKDKKFWDDFDDTYTE